MYREKIRQQANVALSKYGTDVSIDEVEQWGNKLNHNNNTFYFHDASSGFYIKL